MMFNWETIGSGDLLMLALPHHMDTMETNGKTTLEVDVLKGSVVFSDKSIFNIKYVSYEIKFRSLCHAMQNLHRKSELRCHNG